jgi:hypothetical protein
MMHPRLSAQRAPGKAIVYRPSTGTITRSAPVWSTSLALVAREATDTVAPALLRAQRTRVVYCPRSSPTIIWSEACSILAARVPAYSRVISRKA